MSIIEHQSSESRKKEKRTHFGLKEGHNPLFRLSFDPYKYVIQYIALLMITVIDYRSTPVECLHTILLGPYKYFLAELMERLQPKEKREIEARIAAIP